MTIRNVTQPGGSTTQFQYNNAGVFGGASPLTFNGTDITHGSNILRHSDNINENFGTSDVWSQSSDGTNLILTRNSGAGNFQVGAGGIEAMLVDRIGLGGTATSTNFWINFTQTTNKGRGALNFDDTYTGANPQSIVLAKLTYQGTAAGPIGYPYLSQLIDDYDDTGLPSTCNYGNYAQMGTVATRNIAQGTRNFWGWRVEHSLGVGDGLHTGGTIRQYGLWVGTFADYVGVTSQLKHGIFSEENISTRASKSVVFDSTSTAMGDTRIGYVGASTRLETDVDGVRVKDEYPTYTDLNVPPQRMGMSKGVILAAMNGYGA